MNVFVLCTGRCGSDTFAKACEKITNYTAARESQRRSRSLPFRERYRSLRYPGNHIEVDNRLSWFLGSLDKEYGADAFYVHLLRDREEVARSFLRRWDNKHVNIIVPYTSGILTYPPETLKNLPEHEKLEIAGRYWDTVNDNIRLFLRDKPNQMTMWLQDIKEPFVNFWHRIGAHGDLASALEEWDTQHNASTHWKAEQTQNIHLALEAIKQLISPEMPWIIVDDEQFAADELADFTVLPFLERNGQYWGRPESDEQAIEELERLRKAGAGLIAFVASSTWWLDYYRGFKIHIESNFKCVLRRDYLIVFDLQREDIP